MITLAIDLGGSHATCAVLVDDALRAKELVMIRTDPQCTTFAELLHHLAGRLRSLCSEVGIECPRADGLVFGFPGIVNAAGTTVNATNQKFDQARGFDFDTWSREQLGTRCIVENDARLALLGEHHSGAAKGVRDVALVLLGTGIGAAVMLEGKALRGESGCAGCLGGHLPVVLGGRLCTCGNVGCAEAEAATWALPGIAREVPGFAESALALRSSIDFASLFACADAGDKVAEAVLTHCYAVWSALAVALFHAYSPSVLLFGGGVMARHESILAAIRKHVEAHAWNAEGAVVRSAALGADAALYGAIPRLYEVLAS